MKRHKIRRCFVRESLVLIELAVSIRIHYENREINTICDGVISIDSSVCLLSMAYSVRTLKNAKFTKDF